MAQSCRTCRFWKSLEDAWSGTYDDCDPAPLQVVGLCRRYPPTRTGEKQAVTLALLDEFGKRTGQTESTDYDGAAFPSSDSFAWCGEWHAQPR